MKVYSWKYAIFALCIFSSGCGSEAENKFDELCKKEAGSWIYKQVLADGFFDASERCDDCWYPIVEDGYSYIDVCIEKPKIGAIKLDAGCWRFFRANINDSSCRRDIARYTERKIKEKGENYCIAAEVIGAPKDEIMSLFKERTIFTSEDGSETLSEEYWEIRDNKRNELLAQQKNYELHVKNRLEGGLGNRPCDESHKFKIMYKLYQSVITPASKGSVK